MGERQRTLLAGDAVRALAAMAVLVFHVWVSTAQRTGETFGVVGDIALHLSVGLYIFFVLSGYLVGGPFVRAWLLDGPSPSMRRYAGRRVRRIVPAFWVVLTVLMLWFGTFGASAGEVLSMFAFAQNFDPSPVVRVLPQGWTLDIEAAFYAVLPLLALASSRVRPRSRRVRAALLWAALAVVLVGGLALRARYGRDNDPQANLLTLGWAFVPGMALAAVEVCAQSARRAVAWTMLGAALAAFAALVLVNPGIDDGLTNVLDGLVGTGVVAGALVWQWSTGDAPRAVRTGVAHALGRWSFGVYLIHVGVGLELARYVPSGAGPWTTLTFMLVGVTLISTALAAALWWLVEEPFIERRLPRLPWQTVRAVTPPPAPPTEERAAAPVP